MSKLLNALLCGPARLGKSFCCFAPDPPPPIDYAGAAKQQGAANVEAARVQGQINNPNVVNPYGTQTVTWQKPTLDQDAYNAAKATWDSNQKAHMARYGVPIPEAAYKDGYRPPNQADYMVGGNTPTITQTFSPQQQALFDEGNKAKLALSQLASRGAGAAGDVIGKNVDFSGIPDMPGTAEETRQKVVDSMMQRVNEDYGRAQDDKHSALIAAGIRPGTKAYDDAMQLLQRGRNDASTQAWLAGGQEMSRDFNTDMERRRAAIADYLTQRQVPLNEVTALMSGSQVANPFSMPGYAQNANVQPAPLFAAQNALSQYNTDLYNARAANAGNLQQGLFGLGGAGLMAGGMAYSDRRLKSNIVQIGRHPIGVDLYEYDIFGRRERGVMADELAQIMPDAVLISPDGYQLVNYSMIGGRDGLSL